MLKLLAYGQQKRATCFTRFNTHVQTCFATNQVVSGCKKLLKKVENKGRSQPIDL